MPFVVNLSCIHTLYPISTSVGEFARLCKQPTTGCLSCCPGFFHSGTNYAWVMYQYHTKYTKLIEPYKLGKISTEQFLENLALLFPLEESGLDVEEKDDERANLIPTPVAGYYSQDPKFKPLEAAWNAIIGLEASMEPRLSELVNKSEPVYLISNTNELNVFAILALLREKNPQIAFFNDIDIGVRNDNSPIEIAANIFLCLSYRYQCFKNPKQNEQAMLPTTPSLLKYLVEEQLTAKFPVETIQVISQFDGDLAEATRLKISATNVHKADSYFGRGPVEEPPNRRSLASSG